MKSLPNLSRFELQCLKKLWSLGDVTVGAVHEALEDAPSYSTVRKIIERLERKGAVRRVRKQGRAWVYRSAVPRSAMLQKEIRRFLDTAFDGSAAPLVTQLADMDEISLADLREIEAALSRKTDAGDDSSGEGGR